MLEGPWEERMSKVGRNEACPCGSGKKYKRCCLERDEEAVRAQRKLDDAIEPPHVHGPGCNHDHH